MNIKCSQCLNASKYKCPKKGCNARYCSVACCKEHKNSCAHIENIIDKNTTLVIIESQNSDTRDSELNLLTDSQKETLKSSIKLNNVLKSKRLRECIVQIDSSRNRQASLKAARKNPEFEEFIDTLLHEIK
jgi:hypothetical protein